MARGASMPLWDSRRPHFAYDGKWPVCADHSVTSKRSPGQRCLNVSESSRAPARRTQFGHQEPFPTGRCPADGSSPLLGRGASAASRCILANGRFHYECLSVEWIRARGDARVIIEAWRQHTNRVRPHSCLAYLTPLKFKQQLQPAPNQAVSQG